MSKAACLETGTSTTGPVIQISGTIQWLSSPCKEGEDCPPCLTPAIVTDEKTYYLSSSNQEVQDFLDHIESAPVPAIYLLPLRARASGVHYTRDNYDFLTISSLNDLYVQYFSDQLARISSLCDKWNVLHEPFSCMGPYCYLQTNIYRLTTDTLIQNVRYVKLMEQEGTYTYYKGALREGSSRDIYYVPEGSTHEYLLYAFNAQVGDTLTNLWIGGVYDECPNGYNGIIQTISDGTPRKFTIAIAIDIENDPHYSVPRRTEWIEGVGFLDNPTGPLFFLESAVDYGVETILCAYKNGEQVYSSSKAERYGCEFNGIPSTKPYSLCDTWNVMEVDGVTCGGCEVYRTMKYGLTTDTIINQKRYARIEQDKVYKGALREGNNRDIYYIPSGSMHEYLLYSFNSNEGDVLSNLWIGNDPNGWTMTVVEIQNTNPRTFVLSTGFTNTEDGIENHPLYIEWIEGVGLFNGPIGSLYCVGCANSRAEALLCAYKNGEQVYASELSEQYGCEYNYNPFAPPADTIPLYAQDDPGSSTVDPVDPNQVVATLQGDQLTIHENMGVDITYSLQHNAPAQTPAQHRTPQTQTFRNEVTVQITESGEYLLQLTNPSWGYTIFGQFNYVAEGIENIQPSDTGVQKEFRDGQLLIRRGDKIYTVTGQQIQ